MNFVEKKCDLFTVPDDYLLVQCISSDFGMGKGIAVAFNNKYNMKEQLIKTHPKNIWDNTGYCLTVPGVAVFNLVTKQNYWHKPTYKTITQSLQDMLVPMKKYSVTKIAMPRIGCGLDRLQWDKVKDILLSLFEDTDCDILICYQ